MLKIKNIVIILGIIIIAPLILGVIITYCDVFAVIAGDAESWIAFWGSYLGGIVGLMAVMYTTHIMLKQQDENHKEIMKQQEVAIEAAAEANDKKERKRFKTIYYIEKQEKTLHQLVLFKENYCEYSLTVDKFLTIFRTMEGRLKSSHKDNHELFIKYKEEFKEKSKEFSSKGNDSITMIEVLEAQFRMYKLDEKKLQEVHECIKEIEILDINIIKEITHICDKAEYYQGSYKFADIKNVCVNANKKGLLIEGVLQQLSDIIEQNVKDLQAKIDKL
ncbi:hypothetical protein GCM10007425_12600 [Lysinibacillus alkalisoli]|uniref:Uncharacterized protein n=1 Tax=Lysinibacillus alkalisoli TaxID=1911548 RepID=A0A917G393_9BACI|nr:hypothetical protein [Lysinibacillus alkalisoli]GGG19634.1 hypothetical protein GCM10007425_12600 [Lysinibacillus alkalisoli]